MSRDEFTPRQVEQFETLLRYHMGGLERKVDSLTREVDFLQRKISASGDKVEKSACTPEAGGDQEAPDATRPRFSHHLTDMFERVSMKALDLIDRGLNKAQEHVEAKEKEKEKEAKK